jgi:hypothetical protein
MAFGTLIQSTFITMDAVYWHFAQRLVMIKPFNSVLKTHCKELMHEFISDLLLIYEIEKINLLSHRIYGETFYEIKVPIDSDEIGILIYKLDQDGVLIFNDYTVYKIDEESNFRSFLKALLEHHASTTDENE